MYFITKICKETASNYIFSKLFFYKASKIYLSECCFGNAIESSNLPKNQISA